MAAMDDDADDDVVMLNPDAFADIKRRLDEQAARRMLKREPAGERPQQERRILENVVNVKREPEIHVKPERLEPLHEETSCSDSDSDSNAEAAPSAPAPPLPQPAAAPAGLTSLPYATTGPRAGDFLRGRSLTSAAWRHLGVEAEDQRNKQIPLRPLLGAAVARPEASPFILTERVKVTQQHLPPEPPAHQSVARALGLRELSREAQRALQDAVSTLLDDPADVDELEEVEPGGAVHVLPEADDLEGHVRVFALALSSHMSDTQAAVAQEALHALQRLAPPGRSLATAAAEGLGRPEAPVPMLVPGAVQCSVDLQICGAIRPQ